MSNIFAKLAEVSVLSWSVIGVIIALSLIGLFLIHKKGSETSKSSKTNATLTTKKIVYGGICISIAFILSYIRLYKMPQGGSITLASMFPIILYSLVFGPVAGIVAGVAYGLLQLIQDLYIVHWAQLLLDYPLAFGCLGLAGIAPKAIKNLHVRTTLGICIAIIGRGIMHFLSGYIFFSDSSSTTMGNIIYSLTYNASYIIPELIITLILALVLISTPLYSSLKKGVQATY